MTTVDFSTARFKHLNWKFRIRNFLDGKETLTAEQAVSHHHCDLGKWFYAEGKVKYGHLPSMQAFEVEHEKLHTTVKEIQQAKTKGELAKAEGLYKDLTKMSDKIVGYLTEAEKAING
ncbi:MAG: CZB domain-containing protein [Bacteroidetes bacterium]|nr:CZB domain-containing protein [Bacteroidota bacterium]